MISVRIDKRLNLVIPVTRSDETQIFVHSTPIDSAVFDVYYKPIARAFNELFTGGYGIYSGPRIANKLLRDVAKDMGLWDGLAGVEKGLLAEIYRRTTVLGPAKRGGWEPVLYEDALANGLLEPADAAEVEGAICFFTVVSCMNRKEDLPKVLDGAAKLWGAQTTLSNSTEYMSSLPILITAASTGAKAAA